MNWVEKLSRINECVTIGRCNFSWLLFADALVLLASSESGLQYALNGFAVTVTLRHFDIAGMKISTSKIEVQYFSKNSVQCFLQVDGVLLKQEEKFKYRGVAFTRDGK